jgi:hypothetical protein
MASEAKRAARALIERRVERFESRHPLDESRTRLDAALARAHPEGRVVLTPRWAEEAGKAVLEAGFDPTARAQRFLKVASLAMTLLIAMNAWLLLASPSGDPGAWLLTLFTVLAVLGLPFVFIAMGSSRLADEARIRRAIRAALLDEEEKLPPAKKWDDEGR